MRDVRLKQPVTSPADTVVDVCPDRPQSAGEEIANSVSHGLGLLAAAVGLPILIMGADRQTAADGTAVIGAAVFGVTLILLYFTSTLYHALAHSRAKRFFHVLDHGAIYLLIAGTYTPFTLGVLRGPWGWSLFAVVWCLALTGVTLKTIAAFSRSGIRGGWISTGLYVAMGWLVLVVVRPLWSALPGWGVFWLLAGGVAYTAGVGFYASSRIRYAHFIWHLFVLAGSACHFVAVLYYAAPPRS